MKGFMSLKELVKAIVPNSMIPAMRNLYCTFDFLPVYIQANFLRAKHRLPRYLDVRIDINNTCNLRCKYCYILALPKSRTRIMTTHEFRKIADELFPLAKSLNLSCGWEPLMVKNFIEYIKLAVEYKVPYLAYTTNGQLLTDEIIQATIDYRVNEIQISIDAATRDLYEEIRVNGSFDRVINNLKLIHELKNRSSSKYPRVEIKYTVFEQNSGEVPLFIEKFHKYFDAIYIGHLLARTNNELCPYTRMSEDAFKKMEIEAKRAAKGKKINLSCNFVPIIKNPPRLCSQSLRYILISSNGDVMLCIQKVVGNIFQDSYDKILRKNKGIYRKMYVGKDEHCRVCEM